MAGPTIDVEYRAKTTGLEQGLKSAESTAKSTTKSIGTVAAGVFGGAMLTKAASAAKNYFSGAIKGAIDAEDANVRFATSLHNIVGANDSQVAAAQKFIASMSKQAAVSKGELRPAFETLLRGTKDTTKAQGALKTALDISAGTGKPLAQVSQAITKGYLGNVGALGRLGIATKDASGKTLTMDQVMQNANKTFGGQAAKQADTAAGRMRNFQLQMKALQVTVGQDLMPIIQQLISLFQATLLPVLTTIADLFKKYPGIMQAVAAAILAAVVAVKLYTLYTQGQVVVVGLVTAAQWLWNAAVAANPITLIIIAIVAFIAIIVALLVKFGILQAVAGAVWSALQTAFHAIVAAGQWLWNWFASNWPLLVAIIAGPMGIIVYLIIRNWETIKAAIGAALAFIRSIIGTVFGWVTSFISAAGRAWGAVIGAAMNIIRAVISGGLAIVRGVWAGFVAFVSGLVGTIRGIMNAIGQAFMAPVHWAQSAVATIRGVWEGLWSFFSGLVGRIGGVASSIAGAVKGPINAVLRAWNALEFQVPKVDIGPIHFGGQTLGLPDIPLLARGGITKTAGLAYLHPAEVITPLEGNAPARGPAVNIEHATFAETMDVDLFMKRVAWLTRAGVGS